MPFCDHRLVDYVFNIPWHLKTFDGREKSILRAATRKLLPKSIVERRRNPYPSTQDPAYEKALREVAEVLEDRAGPVASEYAPRVPERGPSRYRPGAQSRNLRRESAALLPC